MTTEQILTSINIILTSATFIVGYLTFNFYKKKDYEDKIFDLKLEFSSKLNGLCFKAYKRLNTNNLPFKKMEEYKSKSDWLNYYEKERKELEDISFEIEDYILNGSYFIQTEVLNRGFEFAEFCLNYVRQHSEFDKDLNEKNYKKIFKSYCELLKELRDDLGINELNSGLIKRINNKL